MNISLRDPQVIKTVVAGVVVVGGVMLYNTFRKRPDPLDVERQRRDELVKTGRTIDGTLLDVTQLDVTRLDGDAAGKDSELADDIDLILYQYEVAGVVYECSQDVTQLRDRVNIHDCRIGFPATIRYDARHPENSIIVAEDWSGLRDTAHPFQLRQPARNPAGATIPRR